MARPYVALIMLAVAGSLFVAARWLDLFLAPDRQMSGFMSRPASLGLDNHVVLRIDPAGEEVEVLWESYTGHSLGPFPGISFHRMELHANEASLVLHNKGGDHRVTVNGAGYDPGQNEQLLIAFERPDRWRVSVEKGGDYEKSVHMGDLRAWRAIAIRR